MEPKKKIKIVFAQFILTNLINSERLSGKIFTNVHHNYVRFYDKTYGFYSVEEGPCQKKQIVS